MRTAVPDPLLPVGRDCDCGNPLVWRAGKPWCAVYGSHPAPVAYRSVPHPAVVLCSQHRRREPVEAV